MNRLPITFAGHEPRQEEGLGWHVLPSRPISKGPGEPSESGEILGGLWGWSLFRGVEAGGCDGLPAFLDLSLPIYAVGVMAPGLPRGRDSPDLDSTSRVSHSTGPMWLLTS